MYKFTSSFNSTLATLSVQTERVANFRLVLLLRLLSDFICMFGTHFSHHFMNIETEIGNSRVAALNFVCLILVRRKLAHFSLNIGLSCRGNERKLKLYTKSFEINFRFFFIYCLHYCFLNRFWWKIGIICCFNIRTWCNFVPFATRLRLQKLSIQPRSMENHRFRNPKYIIGTIDLQSPPYVCVCFTSTLNSALLISPKFLTLVLSWTSFFRVFNQNYFNSVLEIIFSACFLSVIFWPDVEKATKFYVEIDNPI